MFDHNEVKVFKTPGGISSDAWTASVELGLQASTVRITARGENRDEARKNLARLLRQFGNELAQICSELTP